MTDVQTVTPDYLRRFPLPRHEAGGDKQRRGRVLVIAGSLDVPGAALLAGLGALRAGAGILQIATCKSVALHLGVALPEALVIGCAETRDGGIAPTNVRKLTELARGCDGVLIGPGMMDKPAVARLTLSLLKSVEGPQFILDAAALTELRDSPEELQRHAGHVVITPHSGEMAAFLGTSRGDVENDPLSAARKAAALIHGVVAMKGASTHIVSAEGEAWLCDHGTIGLGTSGSGDTLAGILAGLLARGAPPHLATIWSVYLHAEAGQRLAARHGTFGLLAREIPGEIPRIMADLEA